MPKKILSLPRVDSASSRFNNARSASGSGRSASLMSKVYHAALGLGKPRTMPSSGMHREVFDDRAERDSWEIVEGAEEDGSSGKQHSECDRVRGHCAWPR